MIKIILSENKAFKKPLKEMKFQKDLKSFINLSHDSNLEILTKRQNYGKKWYEVKPIHFRFEPDQRAPIDEQDIYVNIAIPASEDDMINAKQWGMKDATHSVIEKCCYEDFQEAVNEGLKHIAPGCLIVISCFEAIDSKGMRTEVKYISFDGDDFRMFVQAPDRGHR